MRYADFTDEIRRDCVEAPFETIERETRTAAIEFCQKSRFWTEHRVVEVKVGESDVRLKPSQEGRVDQVLKADYLLNGSTYRLAKVMDRRIGSVVDTGLPRAFSEGRKGTTPLIRLYPGSKEAASLDLYVVLVPQRDSRMIPDHIGEEWRDAIVHGALSRLLLQSGKPWTSPEKAAYHKHEFALAVRNARQEAASDSWAPHSIPLRKWV